MTGCRLARLLLACGILLICATAGAQEPRQDRRFGLTVGYPSSSTSAAGGGLIGLVWQTSDRTAFRPEVSFGARFAGENTTGNSTAAGVTVTVLRYFARRDAFRAYWGPRFSYSRSTSSGVTSDSTSSAYGVGPSFGLQYELTRRIGIYGEVGAVYTYQHATITYSIPGPLPQSPVTSHAISSRGGLGLNLYF